MEGKGGGTAAPSPDRLRRSARPSPACRERRSATAGGMRRAHRVDERLGAKPRSPRRRRRRAERAKEDLGGEQSPWKDRAIRRRQRRGIATDSSAEQGLEVGHSAVERAGVASRKRASHRRAKPSPAQGSLRWRRGVRRRGQDLRIRAAERREVATAEVCARRRRQRDGEGLRQGRGQRGSGREAPSRGDTGERGAHPRVCGHFGATAAPGREGACSRASTNAAHRAPARAPRERGVRDPRSKGRARAAPAARGRPGGRRHRAGLWFCEGAGLEVAREARGNGKGATAAVTRYGC
jgi:hypothetical protein